MKAKPTTSEAPRIPLRVAAVEHFVNGLDECDREFLAAWAAAPAMLRALANGTNQDNTWDYIRARVEAAADREPGRHDRSLFSILKWIEEKDSDYLTTLQLAFMAPSFNLGLALGCALMADLPELAIAAEKDGTR